MLLLFITVLLPRSNSLVIHKYIVNDFAGVDQVVWYNNVILKSQISVAQSLNINPNSTMTDKSLQLHAIILTQTRNFFNVN